MRDDLDLSDETIIGRRTPAEAMPRVSAAFRGYVGGIGLALVVPLFFLNLPGHWGLFILFAGAIVFAELVLRVRVAPAAHFTISPSLLFAYFIVDGGIAVAGLDALTRFVVWFVRTRRGATQTPLYALFTVGQHALAALVAAMITGIFVGGDPWAGVFDARPVTALTLFAVVYFVTSSVLTVAAVWTRSSLADVKRYLLPVTIVWDAVSIVASVPFAVVTTLVAPQLGLPVATIFGFLILAAIALIIRLNVGLRHGNEELRALNRLGSLLTSTLALPEIMRILASESRRVLPSDGFLIALRSDRDDRIDLTFFDQAGQPIERTTLPPGRGLVGRAIARGELVHFGGRGDALQHQEEGVVRPRSMLVAPLRFGSDTLGAISVQSLLDEAYGPSEFRLLETIAGQAAIAVRNAQLFESEAKARQERDEFFSLVTHEIKNPLTSIDGFARLASDAARQGQTEAVGESLDVIRGEAQRILRLAEDLLESEKMIGGRFRLRFERVDLRRIVSDVVRRYATTTDRTIRFLVPEESDFELDADRVRLGQVVENLVSNAVKYSDDGPIDVSLSTRSDRLVIAVRDRGNGIPEERKAHLFERFYRIEEEGREVKGTGLGLFISREIVTMHGGTIGVESSPGEGSTFTVVVPRNARHAEDAATQSR